MARRRPVARSLGWAALVVLLAAQGWALYVAEGAGTPLFPHADKVGHLGMFALPAFLAVLLRSRVAVLGILVHALLAEPLQGWLTTARVTDGLDTVANLAGVAVGAVAALVLVRRP